MADTPNKDDLNDINKAGVEYLDIVRQQAAAIKELSDQLRGNREAQASVTVETEKTTDLAKKLSTFTKETLKSNRSRQRFEKTLSDVKGEQVKLQEKITLELKKETDVGYENAKILSDQLDTSKQIVKEAVKLTEAYQELDRKVKFFDDLSNLVQDVPVLRSLFPEIKKAAEAARDAGAEGKNSFLAGLNQLSGVALKATFGLLIKNIGIGQTRVTEFSRQLNVSRQQAQELNNNLVKAARSSGFLTDEMMQFQMSTAQALGVSTNFNESNARQTALLTSRLGLSVEQSQKLFELSAGTGQNFEKSSNSITGQVLALNDANDTAIRYQTVMADIAEASTATALTTSKFPGGVAKAAFEARKFGLSLRQLESSSSALLDFQSSIEAELEAELLTGRALNLERARAAALTGDQATLAAELAKNFGTAEEFLNQNVLAQEAQAKALGMTRDELASTLSRQEALNQLAKDFPKIRFDGLTLEQKVAKLKEQGLTREQALEKLGESELARQEKNLSIQDNLAKVLDSLNNILTPISTAFDFIGNVLKFAGENAGILVGAMTAFAALRFRNIGNLLKSFRGIGNLFGKGGGGGASQFAGGSFSAGKKMLTKKVAGKGITKGLGKTLLKKIPGVGLLAGIGFGLQRALSGDLAGGGLELASGIASLFPGVGTAASVGIDAALVARDLKRQNTLAQSSQDIPLATGGIVTKPTRALVGEAGAEAVIPLREFYAKMDELISVVKQGGNVYMDGAKVGRATVLAGTNLS